MDIKKNTIRNSAYGLIAQLVMLPIQIVTRYALLKYIGVEVIGISATMASVIGIMSLAEGGFGTAIYTSLYKPLATGDMDRVNQLITIYKRIYRIMALIVVLIGLILMPFLRFILKEVEITPFVYAIHFLYCANSAASYLLCYKRTLLCADVKEYITKRVDILCSIFFSLLSLILIVTVRNYLTVLTCTLLQTIISNLIIHVKCNAYFPDLKPVEPEKALFREVAGHSKRLFAGNLAGYVYNSTDNILISSFINTANVGYLSNYTLISNTVKTLASRILAPITPTLGHLQGQQSTIDHARTMFYKHYQLCYLSAMVFSIPTLVLFDSAVSYFFGPAYLMSREIKWLLSIIIYIFLAAFSYGEFININGRFELLQRVELTGAVLNLLLSVILLLSMGLPGVLLGTVLSGTVQWAMRSYMVYTDILKFSLKEYAVWVMKGFYRILLALAAVMISSYLGRWIHTDIYLLEFVAQGMICVTASVGVYLLLYRCSDRIRISDILSLLKSSKP